LQVLRFRSPTGKEQCSHNSQPLLGSLCSASRPARCLQDRPWQYLSSGRRGDSEHDHVKTPYQHPWTTRVGPRASNLPWGFHPSRQPPIPSQGASNPCPDRERRCRATLLPLDGPTRYSVASKESVVVQNRIVAALPRYVVQGTTADPVQSQRCDPSRVSGAAGFVGTSFWNGKLIVWRTGPSYHVLSHGSCWSTFRISPGGRSPLVAVGAAISIRDHSETRRRPRRARCLIGCPAERGLTSC
jgi:hypothetical protein